MCEARAGTRNATVTGNWLPPSALLFRWYCCCFRVFHNCSVFDNCGRSAGSDAFAILVGLLLQEDVLDSGFSVLVFYIWCFSIFGSYGIFDGSDASILDSTFSVLSILFLVFQYFR